MPAAGPFLFNREDFPIRLEALHWQTRALLWSHTAEEPVGLKAIRIPGRQELGAPVIMRVTFGTGRVLEGPPPPETLPV